MKAHVICISGNAVSEHGYSSLIVSSFRVNNNVRINRFWATTPETLDDHPVSRKWNYPTTGKVVDFASGLVKSAYAGNDPKVRVACAVSHYRLWEQCADDDQPYIILEHDAVLLKPLDNIDIGNASIVGINNPLGATRRSRQYHEIIQTNNSELQPVPVIDNHDIPQGLAGNSAYIMTQAGARQMIKLVNEYGLWPNDALMCRQLVPGLAVTKTYYTHIQGLRSTTTT